MKPAFWNYPQITIDLAKSANSAKQIRSIKLMLAKTLVAGYAKRETPVASPMSKNVNYYMKNYCRQMCLCVPFIDFFSMFFYNLKTKTPCRFGAYKNTQKWISLKKKQRIFVLKKRKKNFIYKRFIP